MGGTYAGDEIQLWHQDASNLTAFDHKSADADAFVRDMAKMLKGKTVAKVASEVLRHFEENRKRYAV